MADTAAVNGIDYIVAVALDKHHIGAVAVDADYTAVAVDIDHTAAVDCTAAVGSVIAVVDNIAVAGTAWGHTQHVDLDEIVAGVDGMRHYCRLETAVVY